MSEQNLELAERRGLLLAELLLDELDPVFVSRPTQDLGYDLLAGFSNDRAGINTVAIQVKSTGKPLGPRFAMPKRLFKRLAHSNLPALLLVADAKRSKLYYAWLDAKESVARGTTVHLPLQEVDEHAKNILKKRLHDSPATWAHAG